MVEVSISGCRKLEGPEADVVESFIVDTESLIRVLHELVNRKSGIVWLQGRKRNEPSEKQRKSTSTTVSETAGLGTTEYVHIMRSGYSSRILDMRRVPIPAPVPPPSEWVIWKPVGHHVYRKSYGIQEVPTLKAISALSLFSYNVQDGVDQLRSFGIIWDSGCE